MPYDPDFTFELDPSEDDPFTQVPNALLRNNALSAEARWLGAWLMSHTRGFKVTMPGIIAAAGCGKDRAYRMVRELVGARYIRRVEDRNEQGQFVRYRYLVRKRPFPENPDAGYPLPANPPHKNTRKSKNTIPEANASGRGSADAADDQPQDSQENGGTVMAAWFDRHPGLTITRESRDRIGAWAKRALAASGSNADQIGAALDLYAAGLREGRKLQPSHLPGMLDQVCNNGHGQGRRPPTPPEDRPQPTEEQIDAARRARAAEQEAIRRRERERAAASIPELAERIEHGRRELEELGAKDPLPHRLERMQWRRGNIQRLEAMLAEARATAELEGV